LEAIDNSQKISDGEGWDLSYRYVRVLSKDDLDIDRWAKTESLNDLPVGTHGNTTQEELAWAGARLGNLAEGAFIAVCACISYYWLFLAWPAIGWTLAASIIALIPTYFLVTFKWLWPRKATPEKLEKIKRHKEILRDNAAARQNYEMAEFDKLIREFSTWESMSPKQFEEALAIELKKQGFKLRVTPFTGDGGIDLEGVDERGNSVIVQAKKYKKNVGVAAVRELVGVRKNRTDNPRAMIVSLVGFTRGAIQFAESEEVILKSIRQDVLGV
jgi:hypothetical protein